ncbi:MAG: Poxvirus family protein, partial [Acidimicrobiales bacterium]|nr:Poxvirus family protein [Acidimicrobiales bacterium]
GLSSGVTAIAAGSNHSCALTSAGAVKCWGLNGSGQLGNNSTATSLVPVDVSGLSSGVTAIAAGGTHSCALTSAGAAKCWGSSNNGQLGNNSTGTQSLVPVDVSGLSSGVTAIAAGGAHSCAVTSAGALKCWGLNSSGQLGNNSTATSSVPADVSGLSSGVTAIAAGSNHSCALTSAGAVKCWGLNGSGQLGNNLTATSLVPVYVSGLSSGVTAIAAGGNHSCGLASGGALKCWGDNSSGQLGLDAVRDVVGGTSFYGGNSAPVASAAPHTVPRGGMVTFNLSASDPDGSALSYTLVSSAPMVAGSSTVCTSVGACTVTVPAGTTPGTYSFTWKVSDGTLDSATVTESVVVTNAAPVAQAVTVNGVQRGRSALESPFSLLATDVNGDELTYTVVASTLPAGSGLSCSTAGACTVSVPADTALGNYPFTYRANDNTANSNTATVTVGVGNTMPVATGLGLLETVVGATLPVALNGTDFNGDTLSYIAPVTGPAKGVVSGSGASRSYVASTGTKGSESFTYTVSDNAPSTSSPGTVAILINNTAPVATAATVSAPRQVATAISLSGTDVNADALTFAVQDAPGKGSLSCSTEGVCTYTPNVGALGTDSFTFVANDGTTNSEPATLTINLSNTAPTANAASVTAPRGIGTSVVLTGSDANGDPITFTIVDQPTKGSVSCFGDAGEECLYQANVGATGSDSFTFESDDGIDHSAPATVAVTLTNQAPTALAVASAAPRGLTTSVSLSATDPNSDLLTYEVVAAPGKGSIDCSTAGECDYHSTIGSTGTDTFTYRANDGDLWSPPATVTVTLTNQAPIANATGITTGRGVATEITLSGSDVNDDEVTYAIVTPPTKGTLDCVNELCTYQSTLSASGTDSFLYRANDGLVSSANAKVTITLVNAAPAASNLSISAPRGIATPLTLTGSDTDGDALSFAIVNQPSKGTVTCSGSDGSACEYMASAGSVGTDTFTYRSSDGTVLSAPATVTVTITNQAPVGAAQTPPAAAPLTPTSITLSAVDPNGDPVTYTVTQDPTKGTLTCSAAGECTYTATSGVTGTDTFKFRADDGYGGLSNIATVTVRLDTTTPGVFVGAVDKMEPESGSGARGTVIPLTLSQPSTGPLTVWYYTSDAAATAAGDYTRFGTQAVPRSITFAPGTTWAAIAPPVRDDNLVEGDETFTVHVTSVTGGPAYLAPAATEVTIHDADSIVRSDPATALLSVTNVRQLEGNATSNTARKAQVRVELSKPLTTTLTLRWTTQAGTAIAGTDFVTKTGTMTFGPGDLEKSVDVNVFANNTKQANRSFSVVLTAINGGNVHVVNNAGVVTIVDED